MRKVSELMNEFINIKKIIFFLIIICIFIVIALNFIMPRIGEDFALSVPYSHDQVSLIEKSTEIFSKIVQHSKGWNARLGEQLAILFLSFNKTFFNILNIFITIIYCYLVLIYANGDFPKIDIKTSYIFLITFTMFFLLPKSGDIFLLDFCCDKLFMEFIFIDIIFSAISFVAFRA